jgi:Amt family ammonium transporter
MKPHLGYDDSLDVFGVHGVGGILGTLATGWFAFGPLSATKELPNGVYVGGASLLGVQAVGVLATLVYGAAVSLLLLKATDWLVGLRVTREEEREGLDIVLHGEQVF